MNALDQTAVEEALAKAQADYERKGYEVIVAPRPNELPHFLEGFAPDALARKGRKSVVIGIMPPHPSKQQNARLTYFAEMVKAQRNWDFHLYFADVDRELADALKEPSAEDVRAGVVRAREIAQAAKPHAALVYAWGLLEAVTRRLVLNERNRASKRYLPSSVIEALVAEGFIDDERGAELTRIAGRRNLIAHGFTRVEVSRDDIELLLNTIERLVSIVPADAA